ncbi:MAG: hypothetical protein J7576_03705 [Siphonobacter aquaeclarae]|nr:hypothetical protein [Siphonobacter aquaeclarae]
MKKILILLLLTSLKAAAQHHHHAAAVTPGDTAWVAENIPLPPGLKGEVGAIDFLPDGRLVATFHRGEIYFYQPKTAHWHLFAEGIHDALGIKAISAKEILVLQRAELTRVRDTDGDGKADDFAVVTDDFGMTGNYHEFNFGPVADAKGNLYIALNTASNGAGIRPEVRGTYNPLGRPGRMYSCVPYRGWVMKLTPDGKLHPYALGFRSPNTLGFDAAGRLLVCDNQGDWLGTSKLYVVKEGRFYGHPASLVWKEGFPKTDPLTLPVATLDSMRTREAVAFPHGYVANSPAQPVVDRTGGKFGPFRNQTLVGEMDHPFLLRVLLEEVGGETQGACIPLYVHGLRRGNNRLAFAPDGSLWVGQTDRGWVGSEGIQRIRWTGKTPLDIAGMTLTGKGFSLTFTRPLKNAPKELFTVKRFYYEYHREYGSKKFDETPVTVTGVTLSPDGLRAEVTLGELKPGYIYEFRLGDLVGKAGERLLSRLACYTLNKVR